MENSLLVGLSRQVALSRELEVISNNVANLNTTGFKSDGALFEQYLMPGARDGQFSGADSRVTSVRDRATWLDLSQGPIQQTGSPLDIAIEGDGYLTVQTPRGDRYTRNGSLQINAAGELVTNDGYRVLGESGPIVFENSDRDITINPDGSIRVHEGLSAKTDSPRGKLLLVDFSKPQQLRKDGSSTFVANPDNQPRPTTTAHVVQGAVEKSNVRGVIEMTRLIEVTRSYTEISALMQQQGEMRRGAIDKLAEVPV
ncbi:MAG: flagellar basal-body rod protein FlgF [Alphaproteobacteria bacterium]|jgi:flagellar basal-body rod protein FlgF|nr:flagellar basal-body rod protein FlgF [Alphaproteobacteria bacterium]